METTCSIPGCQRTNIRARGLCGGHYELERRKRRVPRRAAAPTCAVEGCAARFVVAHGLCDKHYRRFRAHGHTDSPIKSPEERFWRHVDKRGPEECWHWTGGGWSSGYGALRIVGRSTKVAAHRISYEIHVGPVPDGLVIDHLCRNRKCVNPAHLEAVTFRENILRGEGMAAQHARKTHCLRGHSFDPPNGYVTSQGRRCRACDRIRYEAREARKKASRAKLAE